MTVSTPVGFAPCDSAANARTLRGTSSVAISRIPRLVVGSFHRCSAYRPSPSIAVVTPVNSPNCTNEWCAIWLQKLTTSAIDPPMISIPPTNSPQRMLLSRMNAAITSDMDRRGFGGGVGTKTRGGRIGVGKIGTAGGGGDEATSGVPACTGSATGAAATAGAFGASYTGGIDPGIGITGSGGGLTPAAPPAPLNRADCKASMTF